MQRHFKGALSVTYSRIDFKKEMVEVHSALHLKNLKTQLYSYGYGYRQR